MAKSEDVKVAQPRERAGSESLARRRHGKLDRGTARRGPLRADASPAWESARRIEHPEDTPGVSALLKRDALQRRMLGVVDVTAAYIALLIAVYGVKGDHTSLSP